MKTITISTTYTLNWTIKNHTDSGKKLYIIEWQQEEARYWLAPTGKNTGTWKFMDELNHMEIIGNTTDNQNLMG